MGSTPNSLLGPSRGRRRYDINQEFQSGTLVFTDPMLLAAVLAQPTADIVIALFLPGAIMLCFRLAVLLQPERSRKAVWVKYRQATRFLMAATLAAWWAAWDLFSLGDSLAARLPHLSIELGTEFAQLLLFCVPPLAAVGTALVLA